MAAPSDAPTSTVTDDERSEDCSSFERNRPRRKWKKASDFNTTWPSSIYEPNPSCLCDTCENNYHIQLTLPSHQPPRRRFSDTSDEEGLTDTLVDGNKKESSEGQTGVSVAVKNRRGLSLTRKIKGGTNALRDKTPGEDNNEKMATPTLGNTIPEKEESNEIRMEIDGRKERKPTKSESTEPEVEEESSDRRTNESFDISSIESVEETETHNLKINFLCHIKSEINYENRREREKYDTLKPSDETDQTEPSQIGLDIESDLKDGQNAVVQYTNKSNEGAGSHLDKEDCEKNELSEIIFQIDEQKKKDVDLNQKLDEHLENVGVNNERSDEINSSNEPATDGVTEHEKVTLLLPTKDKIYSEKKKHYQGVDLCCVCDKNVAYHFRKQIRERKRSGLPATVGVKNYVQIGVPKTKNETNTALECVKNYLESEIPMTRNGTNSQEKGNSPAGSVNVEASQVATAPENGGCMVMTLPQIGLHFTRDGHEYSQRVASASRRNLCNTGRETVNCRRHMFCRRFQLNRNTNQTTVNGRSLMRRPGECSLRRSFRGLRASLRLRSSQGRRSLRALTFRGAVERGTPILGGGELTVATIGLIKLILG
ncbi:uncharacterized protein [Macrobrachium rosenbergii]